MAPLQVGGVGVGVFGEGKEEEEEGGGEEASGDARREAGWQAD